jgi:hypothetical protein
MTLSWEFVGDDEIKMTLECQTEGYCGIGLGNTKMFPTDMIVAINTEPFPTVEDYYATSYDPPTTDAEQGGSSDLAAESVTFENGVLTSTFRRKLDTGDERDHVIDPNAETDLVYGLHPTDTTFMEVHTVSGASSVVFA